MNELITFDDSAFDSEIPQCAHACMHVCLTVYEGIVTFDKHKTVQQVNLVMNDNSLTVVGLSRPPMSTQMGEYFGFSLLAVDLNGDK